jgi:hypothetical protein
LKANPDTRQPREASGRPTGSTVVRSNNRTASADESAVASRRLSGLTAMAVTSSSSGIITAGSSGRATASGDLLRASNTPMTVPMTAGIPTTTANVIPMDRKHERPRDPDLDNVTLPGHSPRPHRPVCGGGT